MTSLFKICLNAYSFGWCPLWAYKPTKDEINNIFDIILATFQWRHGGGRTTCSRGVMIIGSLWFTKLFCNLAFDRRCPRFFWGYADRNHEYRSSICVDLWICHWPSGLILSVSNPPGSRECLSAWLISWAAPMWRVVAFRLMSEALTPH